MANTPVNVKELKVFLKHYDITGDVYLPIICELNSDLQDAFNEVDATSKCGQYFLPGNSDNAFNITVQYIEDGDYDDTTVVTGKELKRLKDLKENGEFLVADDADTPTIFAREFEALILSINSTFGEEGAATADVSMRIQGEIDDPLDV
jgi:hypothetical protein